MSITRVIDIGFHMVVIYICGNKITIFWGPRGHKLQVVGCHVILPINPHHMYMT
jgi:hypothetical protein